MSEHKIDFILLTGVFLFVLVVMVLTNNAWLLVAAWVIAFVAVRTFNRMEQEREERDD
jgi:1,4-dihydroxy-2-naphthoate octaprenyltransferase